MIPPISDPEKKQEAELKSSSELFPKKDCSFGKIIEIFRIVQGESDKTTKEKLTFVLDKYIHPYKSRWNEKKFKILFNYISKNLHKNDPHFKAWNKIINLMRESGRLLPQALQDAIRDRFHEGQLKLVQSFATERGAIKLYEMTSLGTSFNPVTKIDPPNFIRAVHFTEDLPAAAEEALIKAKNNFNNLIDVLLIGYIEYLPDFIEDIQDPHQLDWILEQLKIFVINPYINKSPLVDCLFKETLQERLCFLKEHVDHSKDKKDLNKSEIEGRRKEIVLLVGQAIEKLKKLKDEKIAEMEDYFKKNVRCHGKELTHQHLFLAFDKLYKLADLEMQQLELAGKLKLVCYKFFYLWKNGLIDLAEEALRKTKKKLLFEGLTHRKGGDPSITNLSTELEEFISRNKGISFENLLVLLERSIKELSSKNKCIWHFEWLRKQLQSNEKIFQSAFDGINGAVKVAKRYFRKEEVQAKIKNLFLQEKKEWSEIWNQFLDTPPSVLTKLHVDLPFFSQSKVMQVFKISEEQFKALNLDPFLMLEDLYAYATTPEILQTMKKVVMQKAYFSHQMEVYAFKTGNENSRELLAFTLASILGLESGLLKKYNRKFQKVLLKDSKGKKDPILDPEGLASVWIYEEFNRHNLEKFLEVRQQMAKNIHALLVLDKEVSEHSNPGRHTLAEIERLRASLEEQLQALMLQEGNLTLEATSVKTIYLNQLHATILALNEASSPEEKEKLIMKMQKLEKEFHEIDELYSKKRQNIISSVQIQGILDLIFGALDSHLSQYRSLDDGTAVDIDSARFGFPGFIAKKGHEIFVQLYSAMIDHPAAHMPLSDDLIYLITEIWDIKEIEKALAPLVGDQQKFDYYYHLLEDVFPCITLLINLVPVECDLNKYADFAAFRKNIISKLEGQLKGAEDESTKERVKQALEMFKASDKGHSPMEEMFLCIKKEGEKDLNKAMDYIKKRMKKECLPYLHPGTYRLLLYRIKDCQDYIKECVSSGTAPTVRGIRDAVYHQLRTFFHVLERMDTKENKKRVGPGRAISNFNGSWQSLDYLLERMETEKVATLEELSEMEATLRNLKQTKLFSNNVYSFLF